MYPRNAASPEPIAIGPVVQISDGAVQTAGVTVRVKPIGVAEADGGGTTAYSTDGVVLYTPTQSETNYTSFVLIAKKTGCIPASVTVVTSARSVTGEVQVGGYASGQVPLQPTVAGRTLDVSSTGEAGIDLANVGSPTTTLNLSGTTISTSQTVASVSGNVGGNVVGSVGSVTSGVTVTTNNDKTNYGLSASALTDIASAVWSAASRTLTGFGSLVTDVANAVWSAGTRTLTAFGFNVTVGGYAAGQSPPSANDIRDAVMNADPNGGWADGSFGDRWLISANNTRNLAITGSGHIAAVLHDAEPNSIPEDAFFTGAFSARVLATDAATEIATEVGNLQVLSRLDSMIESDGNGQFRFDTIALSMAAGGAGGTDWTANERTAIRSILGIPASGTTPADPSVGILDTIRDGVNSIGINVYPVTSSTPERVNGTTITVYKDEQTNVTISTTATLTGLTLRFVAEDRTGADVLVVENASFVARTATSVTLQIPSSVTDEIASYAWTLRDVTTGNSVLARGVLSVQAAASKNA